MSNDKIQVRTERDAQGDDACFILAPGAPRHYVAGHAIVGGGALVTLSTRTKPGDWYHEITREQYEIASADPAEHAKLSRWADAEQKKRPDPRLRRREQILGAGRNAPAAAPAADDKATKKLRDKLEAAEQKVEDQSAEVKSLQQALAATTAERDAALQESADLVTKLANMEAAAPADSDKDGKGGKDGKTDK